MHELLVHVAGSLHDEGWEWGSVHRQWPFKISLSDCRCMRL